MNQKYQRRSDVDLMMAPQETFITGRPTFLWTKRRFTKFHELLDQSSMCLTFETKDTKELGFTDGTLSG